MPATVLRPCRALQQLSSAHRASRCVAGKAGLWRVVPCLTWKCDAKLVADCVDSAGLSLHAMLVGGLLMWLLFFRSFMQAVLTDNKCLLSLYAKTWVYPALPVISFKVHPCANVPLHDSYHNRSRISSLYCCFVTSTESP